MAARPRFLSVDFPKFFDTLLSGVEDPKTHKAFRNLSRELEKMQREIASVVNANQTAIKFVSQDDAPDVLENEILLWKDTDAVFNMTSPESTHYLIVNDGTDIVTFASEETVQ